MIGLIDPGFWPRNSPDNRGVRPVNLPARTADSPTLSYLTREPGNRLVQASRSLSVAASEGSLTESA